MWQSLMCLVVACSYKDVDREILRGEAVRVTSALNDPYLQIKDATLEGNDKYEGFMKDLLESVGNILGFSFNINLVEDSSYGRCISYGEHPAYGNCEKWSGLMGDITSGAADLAVADLTISPERLMAVDFTQPIISGGLVVMTKAEVEAESIEDLVNQGFSFLMVDSGSTERYVSKSSDSTYIKMWQNRKTITTIREGKDMVVNSSGKYALLVEHLGKHFESSDCRIKIVGTPLNTIAYGFAMAKGVAKKSPRGVIGLRTVLDYAIAKVKQDGTVTRLENKWWPKPTC